MRYFTKVDITAAKELTMGLVTFHPVVPEGIGAIFYVHLFFVSVLLMYFPFSKLMHLGGIFLSPTRNMPGNTRWPTTRQSMELSRARSYLRGI